jgi:osmotically inducible lipoprotein OsmB
MKKRFVLIGATCVGLVFGLSGCSSAPGTPGQQGAVVGGATGAAVGASVTKNRALGAVVGGAVGAAGGYVVGNKTGNLDKKDNGTPAPPGTVQTTTADTVDLNHDGFVTLDEIVSLEKSGLSDDEMVRRIQATGLTFDLNEEQRKYLSDHGVSQNVINQLPMMNRTYTTTPVPSPSGSSVISK